MAPSSPRSQQRQQHSDTSCRKQNKRTKITNPVSTHKNNNAYESRNKKNQRERGDKNAGINPSVVKNILQCNNWLSLR
ncbi:MAG: hypothetical protein K2F70_06405, partial [Muribaculaceae bacterium]|nr:hypothetical protein [Muribaculaceae bacterium]